MSGSIERRPDGSLALFIDGDLQFDSLDEHIYHEGLVLPGLLAAQKRCNGLLDVLIVGGGDGLSAREVLKSDSINKVILVDYDPEIVQMALGDFSKLNQGSMADPRLTINCTDAWEFVEEALNDGEQFDFIIVDLTVAADSDGARFHSIDWYENLNQLLSPKGVMAINGVSPHQTPLSYWSVFNSMLKAQLSVRPYRVAIPSFFSRGYGSDWGFFLAAKTDINQDEIYAIDLESIQPKQFLKDLEQLKELFYLPEELYPLQKQAQPALAGSEILIRYFQQGALSGWTGKVSDSLLMELKDLTVPAPDTGKEVLPEEISIALANAISFQAGVEDSEELADPKQVLGDVLRLMPSLEPSQTPDMLADFLSDPGVFLRSVDLSALISRILKRAGSLPPQLVAELKLLSIKLADWTGDQLSLMQMGRNVVTLLALLMVIGNLLYPDMVYAKGGNHDGARTGDHRGEYKDKDGRRRRGDGAWWNEGTNTWVYDDVIKRDRAPRQGRDRVPELEIRNYGNGNKGNNSASLPQPIQAGDKEQTRVMLTADLDEAVSYQNLLKDELAQYMLQDNSTVSFGMHDISRDEAIRLTQRLIDKNSLKIAMLNGLIENLDEA
ncbi:MAG: hypothetical protein KIT34_01255 [Cyanobacteria bacterium TGS_CYA1]|nr:hypothetical protein [Cyanobacteria bacterium TGS_CYA1]